MTAHLVQHVTPRYRRQFFFTAESTLVESWRTRRARRYPYQRRGTNGVAGASTARWLEQGSINQSTITVTLAVVMLLSVVLLGFLYLQQVFSTATQGNEIEDLKTRLMDLSAERRELELKGAELRSLKNVEGRIQELNLVESRAVAYLAASSDRLTLQISDRD